MRWLSWLDGFATPRRILWLGWLLFVVYCYPGYMSTDSVDQLQQARGEVAVHDWHPPLMAWLWRITDWFVAGPFPMLVIQSASFLLGLAAILRRAMRPRTAAIAATLVLLFPPILTPMAVIWKDSQMAGFLLAGIACLLSERRAWRVVGCGLLLLATAQRYNAPAATLPLVGLLFAWRDEVVRWRRYAIAAGVWLAISLAAMGANRVLTVDQRHAWHGSVALFDIVGTLKYAPDLTDDQIRGHLAGVTIVPQRELQRHVRDAYNARAWFWLANDEGRIVDMPHTNEQRAAVGRAWREVVAEYPGAYLHHRYWVFRHLIGLSRKRPDPEWDGFTENPAQEAMIGQRSTHSKLQTNWLSLIPAIKWMVIFRPWLYLLVGLALIPLCRSRLALALTASGLLNQASLFFAAPSADYRYSHWMIACTTTAYLLVFAERWNRGRQGRGELHAPAGRE